MTNEERLKGPSPEEIQEYMESYNADEVGLENPIDLEQAEIQLLNSDEWKNPSIVIPLSEDDLSDLQNGKEFHWCFDGIDCHLRQERDGDL